MKLEAVVIPISDVDRAKEFYERLGWRLDADLGNETFRIVQLNPPGSDCSIQFGTGLTAAAPGSAQSFSSSPTSRLRTTSSSATEVDVSEVFHDASGGYNRWDSDLRAGGPDPQRRTYASFMEFRDPDGTCGSCRRSRPACPGASTPRRPRSAPPRTLRARFAVRRPPTASTRPDRPGGRELARLVRRVHGGGARRRRASS